MKSVFNVAEDGDGSNPSESFEIAVCFNGIPGSVVLEVNRNKFVGYSGSSGDPVTTINKQQERVMRSVLKSSEARAIASAILSAATESRA